MRQLAEKRAWQINELQRELGDLRKKYDKLLLEQQKDRALWIAMCAPAQEKVDESNSPTKT